MNAPNSDPSLRPFHVFYEWLRISLFIPLVANFPEHLAELTRLAANAEARLRELAPPELFASLAELKPQPLAVSIEASTDSANDAYERLFERLTATEL